MANEKNTVALVKPATMSKAEFKKLAVAAARLADDKKAEDIIVLDISAESTLCDFVVIATADSQPQINAIEDEIEKSFKAKGIYKTHLDGSDSVAWRVLDYGGVLIHAMTASIRDFYSLDKVFHFGTKVRWAKAAPKKAPAKAAKTAKPAAKKTAVKKTAKKA